MREWPAKETFICLKRDLHMYEKKPILWIFNRTNESEISPKRPIYLVFGSEMCQQAYAHTWQRGHIYMYEKRPTYVHLKGDLRIYMWKETNMYIWKETCTEAYAYTWKREYTYVRRDRYVCEKRAIHIHEKRPAIRRIHTPEKENRYLLKNRPI